MLKKWSKKKILLCPACGKPYEYCHGRIKIPYFRHMDKEECEDKYSETETEEHLKGKRDLYEWIKCQKGVKNVILEAWLPETKQRPDIMFEYEDKKYVIEYQCSPISTEYIERHELYRAAGIIDIWICGVSKYMKDNMRIKELEKYAIGYYSAKNNLFYYQDCHNGYGRDISIMCRHLYNRLGKTFGNEYPIDEQRRDKYKSGLCCRLNQLNFNGYDFIFKTYKEPSITLNTIKELEYKRDLYNRELDLRKKYDVIETYLMKKLNNIYPLQNWKYLCNYNYDLQEIHIFCNCFQTIYGNSVDGRDNWYDNYISLTNNTYFETYKILKDIQSYCDNITNIVDRINKSLYYFSKKSNVKLYCIPDGSKYDAHKYHCISKINFQTVTEFSFLNRFISILNTSVKYSKDIYIKFPRFIDTAFGCINGHSGDQIKFYMLRLGFTQVFIEQ